MPSEALVFPLLMFLGELVGGRAAVGSKGETTKTVAGYKEPKTKERASLSQPFAGSIES